MKSRIRARFEIDAGPLYDVPGVCHRIKLECIHADGRKRYGTAGPFDRAPAGAFDMGNSQGPVLLFTCNVYASKHVELRLLGCASASPEAENGSPMSLLQRSPTWELLATAVLHLDQLAYRLLPTDSEITAQSASLTGPPPLMRTNSSISQQPAAGGVGSSGAGLSSSSNVLGAASCPASPSSPFAAHASLFGPSPGAAKASPHAGRPGGASVDDTGSEVISAESLTAAPGLTRSKELGHSGGGLLGSLGNIADYADALSARDTAEVPPDADEMAAAAAAGAVPYQRHSQTSKVALTWTLSSQQHMAHSLQQEIRTSKKSASVAGGEGDRRDVRPGQADTSGVSVPVARTLAAAHHPDGDDSDVAGVEVTPSHPTSPVAVTGDVDAYAKSLEAQGISATNHNQQHHHLQQQQQQQHLVNHLPRGHQVASAIPGTPHTPPATPADGAGGGGGGAFASAAGLPLNTVTTIAATRLGSSALTNTNTVNGSNTGSTAGGGGSSSPSGSAHSKPAAGLSPASTSSSPREQPAAAAAPTTTQDTLQAEAAALTAVPNSDTATSVTVTFNLEEQLPGCNATVPVTAVSEAVLTAGSTAIYGTEQDQQHLRYADPDVVDAAGSKVTVTATAVAVLDERAAGNAEAAEGDPSLGQGSAGGGAAAGGGPVACDGWEPQQLAVVSTHITTAVTPDAVVRGGSGRKRLQAASGGVGDYCDAAGAGRDVPTGATDTCVALTSVTTVDDVLLEGVGHPGSDGSAAVSAMGEERRLGANAANTGADGKEQQHASEAEVQAELHSKPAKLCSIPGESLAGAGPVTELAPAGALGPPAEGSSAAGRGGNLQQQTGSLATLAGLLPVPATAADSSSTEAARLGLAHPESAISSWATGSAPAAAAGMLVGDAAAAAPGHITGLVGLQALAIPADSTSSNTDAALLGIPDSQQAVGGAPATVGAGPFFADESVVTTDVFFVAAVEKPAWAGDLSSLTAPASPQQLFQRSVTSPSLTADEGEMQQVSTPAEIAAQQLQHHEQPGGSSRLMAAITSLQPTQPVSPAPLAARQIGSTSRASSMTTPAPMTGAGNGSSLQTQQPGSRTFFTHISQVGRALVAAAVAAVIGMVPGLMALFVGITLWWVGLAASAALFLPRTAIWVVGKLLQQRRAPGDSNAAHRRPQEVSSHHMRASNTAASTSAQQPPASSAPEAPAAVSWRVTGSSLYQIGRQLPRHLAALLVWPWWQATLALQQLLMIVPQTTTAWLLSRVTSLLRRLLLLAPAALPPGAAGAGGMAGSEVVAGGAAVATADDSSSPTGAVQPTAPRRLAPSVQPAGRGWPQPQGLGLLGHVLDNLLLGAGSRAADASNVAVTQLSLPPDKGVMLAGDIQPEPVVVLPLFSSFIRTPATQPLGTRDTQGSSWWTPLQSRPSRPSAAQQPAHVAQPPAEAAASRLPSGQDALAEVVNGQQQQRRQGDSWWWWPGWGGSAILWPEMLSGSYVQGRQAQDMASAAATTAAAAATRAPQQRRASGWWTRRAAVDGSAGGPPTTAAVGLLDTAAAAGGSRHNTGVAQRVRLPAAAEAMPAQGAAAAGAPAQGSGSVLSWLYSLSALVPAALVAPVVWYWHALMALVTAGVDIAAWLVGLAVWWALLPGRMLWWCLTAPYRTAAAIARLLFFRT
eukprot:gene7923-8119_t